VPSGSNIILNYENPASPVLAVRLQELFGMLETPLLINGTVTMTIELLSPAHRPMQVTKDLKSFWDNTYTEVKKELRGKYKKHYWPDDPYSATATSKTKKNM
jgi:ATP-dependent helicase HrpB